MFYKPEIIHTSSNLYKAFLLSADTVSDKNLIGRIWRTVIEALDTTIRCDTSRQRSCHTFQWKKLHKRPYTGVLVIFNCVSVWLESIKTLLKRCYPYTLAQYHIEIRLS